MGLEKRLLEKRESLAITLDSTNCEVTRSAREWEQSKDYVAILGSFETATTELRTAKFPSLSLVIPYIHKLFFDLDRSDRASEFAVTFK